MDTNTFIEKVKQWHKERLITVNGNSLTQTVKLGEEYGELCSGIVRKDKELIKDSISDMIVVMIAILELEGLSIEECNELVWSEIRDRKGVLNEHGNFIREKR